MHKIVITIFSYPSVNTYEPAHEIWYLANMCKAGIFLVLIWGQISAPSQLKNEQKLPKMVFSIPNFLVLNFGEHFMKIRTKIAKLQIHEMYKNVNIHIFMQIFMSFYEGQLKQQMLYTANFFYAF